MTVNIYDSVCSSDQLPCRQIHLFTSAAQTLRSVRSHAHNKPDYTGNQTTGLFQDFKKEANKTEGRFKETEDMKEGVQAERRASSIWHHKLPAALYPLHQFFRRVGGSIRPALLHSINFSVMRSDVLHLQRNTERFSVWDPRLHFRRRLTMWEIQEWTACLDERRGQKDFNGRSSTSTFLLRRPSCHYEPKHMISSI